MRKELADSAARIFDDLCDATTIRAMEQGRWPQALWNALQESGFTLALAPEESGGAGAKWMDIYPLVMACGRRGVPVPLPETIVVQWLLPNARLDGALSLAGSSIESAQLKDGDWHVSGTLDFVPFGGHVGQVATTATLEGQRFLLVFDTDGLTLIERSNLAGEPRVSLVLQAVMPRHAVAWPEDRPGVMELGAALRAAQIAGAIERVLEMTLNYTSERVQFGKPLARFQVIQHHLAVMAEEAAAATIAAEQAFDALDSSRSTERGHRIAQSTAIAKIRTGEAAGKVAAAGHALHGAIGFSAEYDLQLLTRRLWSWRSEFGTDAYWAERLGQQCLNDDQPTLWNSLVSAPG